MKIDCDRCQVRGRNCDDCVVREILASRPSDALELDDADRKALRLLADSGLIAPAIERAWVGSTPLPRVARAG
ncbi:MAG TPA: hypothetical protein VIL34_06520 [Actinopolymorphaceae bacterium]|jgi:hypothetical protein